MTAIAAEPTTHESWETMTRLVRRFVAHRVAANDVDDITQDILIKVLKAGRGPTVRPAWLYTVARNAVVDHYRTRRPFTPLPIDFETEDPGETGPRPVLQELANCLVPAIDALDEPYREAIRMVDIDGMTHLAAARVAGISPSGMKSRVQRGRRRLAGLLETWCSAHLDPVTGQIDVYRSCCLAPGC